MYSVVTYSLEKTVWKINDALLTVEVLLKKRRIHNAIMRNSSKQTKRSFTPFLQCRTSGLSEGVAYEKELWFRNHTESVNE